MINIGIVCDVTWDNYILVHNKFKKLSNEYYRIHLIYNKNLEMLCNCAYNNNLTIIRNSAKTLSECVYNLLKICDFWIIFTNCIEYLTLPQLILNKCNEYNLKYIKISEKFDDFYSFNNDKSFKKTINKLEKCDNKLNIEFFNDSDYDNNYKIIKKELILTPDIVERVKNNYLKNNDNKKNNSIQLLYDKDEYKRNKQSIKQLKEYSTMVFVNNRRNYYKEL